MDNPDRCPCQSGREYAQCCGLYIEGRESPQTAEALMRSRYTAYVMINDAYLLQSWHPSTRPNTVGLTQSRPDSWLGLKIVSTYQGSENDSTGQVEFVARYKVQGKAGRLHERSDFVKEDGHWFYLNGSLLE